MIDVIDITTPDTGLISLDAIFYNPITISEAVVTGSMFKCGIAACPPLP